MSENHKTYINCTTHKKNLPELVLGWEEVLGRALTDGTYEDDGRSVGINEGCALIDGRWDGFKVGVVVSDGLFEGWPEGCVDVEGRSDGWELGLIEGWYDGRVVVVGIVVGTRVLGIPPLAGAGVGDAQTSCYMNSNEWG